MALKNTCTMLRKLLAEMNHDLDKAERGNKTAAQRVRIGTIKFAKVAKVYRKESVDSEKKTSKKRR